MTNEELDAIAQRAEKATPGPWGEVAESGEWWLSGPDIYDDAVMSTNDTEISQADVDFIAAARTDVPALVAEVRRLRGKLEAATASAEAAEKDANELRADNEMNNHYAGRALDAERKLAAVTARAEAAEAKLAQVQRYSAYIASAWLQGSSAFFFEDWLAQRGEAHPRGAPTAVFDASDFEVDESEAQP